MAKLPHDARSTFPMELTGAIMVVSACGEDTMADQYLPVIAKFEVRRRAYLAPDGSVLRDLPDFAGDHDLVVSLYRAMVLARTFDLKAVSLQRTGRLGTYATSLGQEAVAVGVASAMQPEDVLLPILSRQCRAALARRENGGNSCCFGVATSAAAARPGQPMIFRFAFRSVRRPPHAAGVAYAFKYRKESSRRGLHHWRRRDLKG